MPNLLDTDPEPLPALLNSASTDASFFFFLGAIVILLILSALVSGSEVAYFSLSPADKELLENESQNDSRGAKVINLLDRPKSLLATILIANNFINIGIVILSDAFMAQVFAILGTNENAQIWIQIALVTFIILLVGEVIPKVYATKNSMKFSKMMSNPLLIIRFTFKPLSSILVRSTAFLDKRIKKASPDISVNHLEQALELTSEEINLEDKEVQILKGIVKFGNTDTKQVMTPRMDMISLDSQCPYPETIDMIIECGFSRIPVFEENIDQICGVLYVKDLLSHLDKPADFAWQTLIRKPYFVPENKKIDDLLNEFQEHKVHMAIVVDEYGGTSGVVTFEDIIEEIVGDISDEFDDEDIVYSKLDDDTYVFEGKTPLNDMYRVLDIDGKEFEDEKGESDTLAGFLIEVSGKILRKNEKVDFKDYTFTIEAADKKRVKQVKININRQEDEDSDTTD